MDKKINELINELETKGYTRLQAKKIIKYDLKRHYDI